jgi:hypothetical protein
MDKTIILDCQAKVDTLSCEDCLVYKECTLAKKTSRKPADAVETGVEFFVIV